MFELTLTNGGILYVAGRIACITHVKRKKYSNVWIEGLGADPFSVNESPEEIKALMGLIQSQEEIEALMSLGQVEYKCHG